MAEKKPIVNYSGEMKEIANSDTFRCKLDTFTSSGTWTKESWAQTVEVVVVGGGGGGGSGRRDTTANARRGGGGGGSGGFNHAVFLASTLGATVTVTVGAGGTGGGSVTTDSTNGQGATSAAGSSSFGNHLRATAGGPGVGGQAMAQQVRTRLQ